MEYELTRAYPENLKSALRTIEEIEAELGKFERVKERCEKVDMLAFQKYDFTLRLLEGLV